MKQKRFVIAAILLPVVCLAVSVWKFEQVMAGLRLDHALIAAIQRDDAPATVRLLTQGANPNACDAPPLPSFWHWLLRLWRPNSAPARRYPTAAQTAWLRAIPDIAEENPPFGARLRIMRALHDRGAETPHDAEADKNDAEFAATVLGDWQPVNDTRLLLLHGWARARCGNFLRTHGVSVCALETLAYYHALLGDADGAIYVCQLARIWTPPAPAFTTRLTQIERKSSAIRLDSALIAAVRQDDAEGVTAALQRGADPNARDVPAWPDTRVKLLQSDPPLISRVPGGAMSDLSPELQDQAPALPKMPAPSIYSCPTALKIAVYRDMTPFAGEYDSNDDPQAPDQNRFAIIKALHDAGAKPAYDITQREKSLPKPMKPAADENNAADFPRGGNSRFPHNWNAWRAAKFLVVNGMSARAYAELADYCARFGADEWAAHAYQIALLWKPNDAALANAARQKEDLSRVRRAIQQVMPAEWKLERIRPYPSEGAMKRWAVLYSQEKPEKEIGYHCAVYEEGRAGFTLLFQGAEGICGSGIDLEFALYVLPLTGRRLPEIIGLARGSMAGASPAQMVAYAPERNGWKRVLMVDSNQGIWLERHHGERAYVVRNGYETGSVMCHADQPRRLDVYAWNDKEYAFADAKYPELFHEYIKEAEEALRIYPADPDLPHQLASMYSIQGQKQKSERYYRRAERACRKALAQETASLKKEFDGYDGVQKLYARKLKDILARRLTPSNGY